MHVEYKYENTSNKISPTRSCPESSAAVPLAIFFIVTGSTEEKECEKNAESIELSVFFVKEEILMFSLLRRKF